MAPSRIRPFMPVLTVCLLIIGLLALTGNSTDLQRFVDYDGDGFDDNAPDADSDGIPDDLESHSFFSAQHNFILSLSQMSISHDPAAEPKPCAAECFGAREFATRGLSLTRTDFDAGFGSGLGISGGLSGGGACAGGICF